jgi:hypothetical protein
MTITNAIAYVHGGFIYKTAGTTYSFDLRSTTATTLSTTTGSGGFGYLSTGTTGTLLLSSSTYTTSTTFVDGGLFYMGGNVNCVITIASVSIKYVTAPNGNGGVFALYNSGATTLTMSGNSPNNYISSKLRGGWLY